MRPPTWDVLVADVRQHGEQIDREVVKRLGSGRHPPTDAATLARLIDDMNVARDRFCAGLDRLIEWAEVEIERCYAEPVVAPASERIDPFTENATAALAAPHTCSPRGTYPRSKQCRRCVVEGMITAPARAIAASIAEPVVHREGFDQTCTCDDIAHGGAEFCRAHGGRS